MANGKKNQGNKKVTSSKPFTATAQPVTRQATAAVASTAVRNTAIPKPQTTGAKLREITEEMIAQRAYEIWQSGQGGSEFDNWCRAERELRGS